MSADKQRLTKRPEQSWSALRAMFCAERLQSLAASHTFFRAERFKLGGAGRDRTGDLLSANQALSQLSYSPWLVAGRWQEPTTNHDFVIEADWTRGPGTRSEPVEASFANPRKEIAEAGPERLPLTSFERAQRIRCALRLIRWLRPLSLLERR